MPAQSQAKRRSAPQPEEKPAKRVSDIHVGNTDEPCTDRRDLVIDPNIKSM